MRDHVIIERCLTCNTSREHQPHMSDIVKNSHKTKKTIITNIKTKINSARLIYAAWDKGIEALWDSDRRNAYVI